MVVVVDDAAATIAAMKADAERLQQEIAEMELAHPSAAAPSPPAPQKVRALPPDDSEPIVAINLTEGIYAGLHVVCRREAPPGIFAEFSEEADTLDKLNGRNWHFGEEVLISWNLTYENGEDIPPDGEGFTHIRGGLAIDLVRRWLAAVRPAVAANTPGLEAPDPPSPIPEL